MKKLLTLLVSLAIIMAIVGCSKPPTDDSKVKDPQKKEDVDKKVDKKAKKK